MKRLLLAMGFAFAAAAANAALPEKLTDRNKADIVRQIKDHLLDGETARWRWPKRDPDAVSYCGWVNAKNRLGAYVGWTPYYLIGLVGHGAKATGAFTVAEVTFANDDLQSSDTKIVYKMCAQDGYDLSGGPPAE